MNLGARILQRDMEVDPEKVDGVLPAWCEVDRIISERIKKAKNASDTPVRPPPPLSPTTRSRLPCTHALRPR